MLARRGGLILDHYTSHTGDDIAILMTHTRGEGDEQIHNRLGRFSDRGNGSVPSPALIDGAVRN